MESSVPNSGMYALMSAVDTTVFPLRPAIPLQHRITSAPLSRADIAALRAATPAPTMSTSVAIWSMEYEVTGEGEVTGPQVSSLYLADGSTWVGQAGASATSSDESRLTFRRWVAASI